MGVCSSASNTGLLVDASPNCRQRQEDADDCQYLVPKLGTSWHELQQSEDGYTDVSNAQEVVLFNVPGMIIVWHPMMKTICIGPNWGMLRRRL